LKVCRYQQAEANGLFSEVSDSSGRYLLVVVEIDRIVAKAGTFHHRGDGRDHRI